MPTYSAEAVQAIRMMAADGFAPNLRHANLRRANLSEADLSEANLRRADLSEANLSGANLIGADMSGATGYIVGPQRSDGYRFDLRLMADGWRVVAGCQTQRNMTIDQFRDRARGYDDPTKTAETLEILDYLATRLAMLEDTK